MPENFTLFPKKMKPRNLIGLPYAHLQEFLVEHEIEPYRAHQIFIWIYHYKIHDFDCMTNLSKTLRALLKKYFYISLPQIQSKTKSQDSSIKYLFELKDGLSIESVFMPTDQRKTLCVSTQVGCRLACAFCMTGKLGLKRNLSSDEIIGQYLAVNEDLTAENKDLECFLDLGSLLIDVGAADVCTTPNTHRHQLISNFTSRKDCALGDKTTILQSWRALSRYRRLV